MPKTKKRKALLPTRAPKKTGRRGVGPRPLDEEKPGKHQLLKDAAKQARLPGMEDNAIEEIETTARQYKAKQSKRMAILKEEVDLKGLLLNLLHRHNKKTYYHDGLSVEIVPTGEKVKVRFGAEPDNGDDEEPTEEDAIPEEPPQADETPAF